MRRQLAGEMRALLRVHQARLLDAAFYAAAAVIAGWSLLVMLKAQFPGDSDGLWLLSFAHDIAQHIPLRGWHLPGAPLYFPELFSILITRGMGSSPRSSLLIHGVCSWLLLGAGIYWGLRLVRLSAGRAGRVAFAAMLVYLLLHCASPLLQPFEYPYSHGGALLGGFLGLLYIAHGLEHEFHWRTWLPIAFVLALSCASDRLILVQFIAPALLVVLVLFARGAQPRSRLQQALGLLVLAPLLGVLVSALVRSTAGLGFGEVPVRYGLSRSVTTIWRMCSELGQLARQRPALAAFSLVPSLFLGARALAFVRAGVRSVGRRSPAFAVRAESWFACAGLAMLISTIATVIVTNMWNDALAVRYLLPVFVLPLALGTILAAPHCEWFESSWSRPFELTLLFLLVLVATRVEETPRRQTATLDSPSLASLAGSPALACLDAYFLEKKLSAGYAEYWQFRPPMLLGQSGVTLAQVTGRMSPRAWADNRFWYTRGFQPGPQRPRYSFVIPQLLDEQWIRERFGPPHEEHPCFGLDVWVYDRPEDVEFRNYLRSSWARATGDEVEWWLVTGATARASEGGTAGGLLFDGKMGVSVSLPRVRANVIELDSPTKKLLTLSYRRGAAEVARQEIKFPRDNRRLEIVPADVDLRTIDSVFISGSPKLHYQVRRIALMWDQDVEHLRSPESKQDRALTVKSSL
jgi:hypothetical protein